MGGDIRFEAIIHEPKLTSEVVARKRPRFELVQERRSALRVWIALSMPTSSTTGTSPEVVVGVIDVGAPRNIGWAIRVGDRRLLGTNLDEFAIAFATEAAGRPAALGFEAPLFIPAHAEFLNITSGRKCEGNRPWSAGAGATVTTIGIAVMLYTLRTLRSLMAERGATLDWKSWPAADDILVFEAFVSGGNHGGPQEHARDALTAASGFLAELADLDAANAVTADDALSLVGACLIKRKWVALSEAILSAPCLVIRPNAAANVDAL